MTILRLTAPLKASKRALGLLPLLVLGGLVAAYAAPLLSLCGIIGVAVVWLVLCLWLVLLWSRTVYFDEHRRQLLVHTRSPLLVRRTAVFPLERFAAVVSYYPVGGSSPNCVALLERETGRVLDITSFDQNMQWRSFWTVIPQLAEAPAARELRVNLASRFGIADGGYLGFRPLLRRCK